MKVLIRAPHLFPSHYDRRDSLKPCCALGEVAAHEVCTLDVQHSQ
jgi:hypothetical protein